MFLDMFFILNYQQQQNRAEFLTGEAGILFVTEFNLSY